MQLIYGAGTYGNWTIGVAGDRGVGAYCPYELQYKNAPYSRLVPEIWGSCLIVMAVLLCPSPSRQRCQMAGIFT